MSTGGVAIGRADELAMIEAVLDRAREGFGSVVLVEGEAGIGKTHLLRVVHGRASIRGLAVCAGTCELLERARPFGPFVEALGVPGPAAAAVGMAGGEGEVGAPGRFAAQEAIVDAVDPRGVGAAAAHPRRRAVGRRAVARGPGGVGPAGGRPAAGDRRRSPADTAIAGPGRRRDPRSWRPGDHARAARHG
ncbi:MAG: ATP-binding protein [Acidimicrobiales bacterium]